MAAWEHISDVAESLCIRSGDSLQRNKALFLDVASDVWQDLNESTLRIAQRVKMPVRQLFHVNKRTNSIDIPPSLRISSVSVIGSGGILYPVYRNDRLHIDLVETKAKRNCACEFNCGYQLCNSIKGYEVINHTEEDKMPNGDPVSFDCVDRKVVMGGFLYLQKQYPQRVYESGVWVDTVKHQEDIKMCSVEVDDNGCVCDTTSNIDAVCDACGIQSNDPEQCCIGGTASAPPSKDCNTWKYYCTSKADWFYSQCGGFSYFRKGCNNIYNISELGNRLLFPHDFAWDHAVVRFYADVDLNNLWIPYMAKETFMTGMMYFSLTNNPKKFQEAAVFAQKYSQQKWGLFLELNKYTLAEQRMILSPPVYVPSYNTERNYDSWRVW